MGALALSAERQSAQMSKIKNGRLDQYGADLFEQQQFGTSGVEGVNDCLTVSMCKCCVEQEIDPNVGVGELPDEYFDEQSMCDSSVQLCKTLIQQTDIILISGL